MDLREVEFYFKIKTHQHVVMDMMVGLINMKLIVREDQIVILRKFGYNVW